MSFACVTDYLSAQFYSFQLKNGECRFLVLPPEEETDEQGFPSDIYTARTAGYLLCSWTQKKADEETIAAQPRSSAQYEITIAQNIEGVATVVLASDRVELRTRIGDAASSRTCEIVSRVNQNGAAWQIVAVDLNELD